MGTEPQKAKPVGVKQPKNTSGLRPRWKPGQSGNPKGRPKGMTLTGLLRKAFEDSPEKAQEFIAKTIAFAMEGQAPYAKEVWERMDGKVREHIQLDADVNVAVKRHVPFGDEANLNADDHA